MSKTSSPISLMSRINQKHQRVKRQLQSMLSSNEEPSRTTDTYTNARTSLAEDRGRSNGINESSIHSRCGLLCTIIELSKLEHITSAAVINHMKSNMARHGVTETRTSIVIWHFNAVKLNTFFLLFFSNCDALRLLPWFPCSSWICSPVLIFFY